MMSDDLIQVVTVADPAYTDYLACCLLSLVERGVPDQPSAITIIHRGIDQATRHAIASIVPSWHSLRWIEPTPNLLIEHHASLDFSTLSPHYLRLLIPSILPNHQKAIYVDADTIIRVNIQPLWEMDLGQWALAASQDYLSHIADAIANWHELGLQPDAPYFNSGIMVINLEAWRENHVAEQVLQVCKQYRTYLSAQEKWPQHDQYGLNVVLYNQWIPISPSWNHGSHCPSAEEKIIHYAGDGKIDARFCQPVFRDIFFELLNRTPCRR